MDSKPSTPTDLDDHDAYLCWIGYDRTLMTSEAPDGDMYVLTEHPQVPGKYHVTKGYAHVHTDREPHVHIAVVTGVIAAQRAAEDHAYDTFPHWKPTLNHPTGQRRGARP